MKLTFAIVFILSVLIAGTTTICLSGAVSARTSEYGTAKALTRDWLNPYPASHQASHTKDRDLGSLLAQ
ncbi:hypothetical protein JOE11_004164 [Robbsia andropogonis]